MTDQELLEWYKNGAQKLEGMSDKDYELNKSNALYAQQNQLLDSNLASQQAGLAQSQKNAQQSASISNDKIMKYLGQAALASGVATGQTGTNFINANNAYQQNRAAINTNYSAQNSDLLQRYAGEKLQIGSDAYNAELGILDKYYGREYQAERDAIADNRYEDETAYNRERDTVADSRYEDETAYNREQDQKGWDYQTERDAINDSRYEDETAYSRDRDTVADNRYEEERDYSRSETEWLKEQEQINEDFSRAEALLGMYLEDYMADGQIDDTEKATIESFLDRYTNPDNPDYKNLGGKEGDLRDLYDMYINSSTQTGTGTQKYGDFVSEDIRAGTKGDNFSMSFNGATYTNLEIGSSASSEVADASKDVPNNSVFICDGAIYIKTASGGVRRVGGTGKAGVDNTGGREGTRQYNNLYAALEKAGYIIELSK